VSPATIKMPDGYSDVPAGKIAAVVTSLEMTARPPPRAERAGHGWTVRPVATPELAWYRDLFRRVGGDWLWFSRARMSDAGLRAIIHDPQVEVFALSPTTGAGAGRDEGLLELDFRVAGECELAFFGLTRNLVGQGAGRVLMNHAIARAWSKPIARFWVHTCTLDHQAAPAFYQRSGFRPFRRQIEIADDPRLIGVLPRDAAPHIPLIE
jgi:GNAT superfamily N-acetyltransferase